MIALHVTLLTQSGGRDAAGELQDLIPKEPRGAGPAQEEDQVIHCANPAWVAAQGGLGTKGVFYLFFSTESPSRKYGQLLFQAAASKPLTRPWRWMQKGETSLRRPVLRTGSP